jgi:lysophospholipase L1-like esterase
MISGRRATASVALVGAAIAISLVLAEVVLRLAMPAPRAYKMLLPGTTVFDPDTRFVQGISGPARYAVNRSGIRGRDFDADTNPYRILLVGGSTTECSLLDENENWGAVAERELGVTRDGRRIWVGNVGRSGLTSRDHYVTLKYLLPQIPKMDVVVILLGVNDLTAALRQDTSYRAPAPLSDPDAEAMQIRNAFAVSPGGLRESIRADRSQARPKWYQGTRLYSLAKSVRTAMVARKNVRGLGGGNLGQWRSHRRTATRFRDQLPSLDAPLADYRQVLQAIAAEARRAGTEVVFLTQPSLWKAGMTPEEERRLWLGGTGNFQEEPGHTYYTGAALAKAMSLYNAETLAVCLEQKLSCLDLAARITADTSMMYDDVHFTEEGAARVGQELATYLRAIKPTTFAPAAGATPARR